MSLIRKCVYCGYIHKYNPRGMFCPRCGRQYVDFIIRNAKEVNDNECYNSDRIMEKISVQQVVEK